MAEGRSRPQTEGGEPQLSISEDKAIFILEKARAFDEKVGATGLNDASDLADDPFARTLEETPDDPTGEELRSAISALNDDEKADLVALIWLGRGDYALSDWSEARRTARDRRETPVADYVCGTPLASDYLEEGLAQFGRTVPASDAARRL